MAGIGEDDSFSDDDLDALPVNALDELEQSAVYSTQQKHAAIIGKERQVQSYHTLPTLPFTPAEDEGPQYGHKAQRGASVTHSEPQLSSDYGNFDDEALEAALIDAEEPPAIVNDAERILENKVAEGVTQREQWRVRRYGADQAYHGNAGQMGSAQGLQKNNIHPHPVVEDSRPQDTDAASERQGHPSGDRVHLPHQTESRQQAEGINELQARIAELLRERDSLQQTVQEAQAAVLAKNGEVAIIRSNEAKRAKEQERKTIALQRLHADEEARRKADIERTRAEKEKVETECRFLQQDLANEAEKSRNIQRRLKGVDGKAPLARPTANASPLTTPKKAKTLPYRDGFDDDEVLLVSSSKSNVRSQRGTPKAGAKRKRRANEGSPSQPLQLSEPKAREDGTGRGKQQDLGHTHVLLQELGQEDERFKFMQKLLNHRAPRSSERTFEVLTRYSLPSTPGKSICSALLDSLSFLARKTNLDYFPADFCLVVISLWLQCTKETYYKPLSILMDLLKFILALDTMTTAPYLIHDLLHVAQLTADVNAIPRFRAEPASSIDTDIDVSECLALIHLVALGCLHNAEEILHFWKRMRWDFAIMMLKPNQPLEDILMIVQILTTGSLEASFGPIKSNEAHEQETNEKRLIDPISLLLVESPTAAKDEDPYDNDDINELRLEVLGLLGAICLKQHGGKALAKHPLVIGRLVKLMYDELDSLYDYVDGHEESANIVNLCIRLLYHILTNFSALVDMQAKLAVIHGGSHKYVVGLTRLAFSEGLVLEAGIDEDVIDCAHSLLEDRITLDEGEALLEVFPQRSQA
ncbi:MAG: hypothetical protein M1836_005150 [Candelina mexicana]|nr:MAG: hypothetical protein M1836_005150 [Candelina mexicana]